MKIIDLSLPIKNNAAEPISSKIKYVNYKKGGALLGMEGMIVKGNLFKTILNFLAYFLGIKKVNHNDFPDNMGLSWENLKTMTHRGTHVDAPSHFGPIVEGEKAKTVEDLPLHWFFNDAVLLDMSHKKGGEHITLEDIQTDLKNINYKLKPLDIVLIRTDTDQYWDTSKYLNEYPGLTVTAVEWILKQGIKVIGIDSYSLDLPSSVMIKSYLKDKNQAHLWPVHMLGRKYEYCHIEKLTHLNKLPKRFGFKVCCFPVLIEKASAGWCRAIAII